MLALLRLRRVLALQRGQPPEGGREGLQLQEGLELLDAIREGSTLRFRPIILTSLTTFFGLAPMDIETSVQARFLIPMAVSLSYGVLFATVVSLVLVPCLYLVLEDLLRAGRWLLGRETPSGEALLLFVRPTTLGGRAMLWGPRLRNIRT